MLLIILDTDRIYRVPKQGKSGELWTIITYYIA